MSRCTRSPCNWGNLERQLQSKLNLSRCRHRAPAKITDRAGGLQHKRACVVPALGIAEDRIVGRAWPDVRPFVNGEINGVQVSRLVVAEPHFKWSARLRCHDAVELPASHQQPG